MPLLDHFHPPLHGPRRWEGFLHSWAASIAGDLNESKLPANYFAEPEISLGPELEFDVATMELDKSEATGKGTSTLVWAPARPKISVPVSFAHLEGYEVRIYEELDGAELRAAIELISPANKDRSGSRRAFAAKCAGYLKQGISVVIVDVVTSRSGNMHEELFEMLEIKSKRGAWKSSTGLYAVAYRPVTVRKKPRIEVWPESLKLGQALPEMPLWLWLDLCVPVDLEESYSTTCRRLRIAV